MHISSGKGNEDGKMIRIIRGRMNRFNRVITQVEQRDKKFIIVIHKKIPPSI